MKNARRYNDRITIGLVPSSEDLLQLKDLGYKTIIDLRDDSEKFGGLVEKRAVGLGLSYSNIPVARDAISLGDVKRFYEEVFRKENAPIYVFSRFGKKPVVFLLLFETVAKRRALVHLYRKADSMGFRLQGDISFQSFLLSLINSGELRSMVDEIQERTTDFYGEQLNVDERVEPEWEKEEAADAAVADMLLDAMSHWMSSQDVETLRGRLSKILEMLKSPHSASN